MVGEGTYDHITHAAGNAVDSVENGIHAAGQGLQNAYQGAGQMVQGYQQQAIMPQQQIPYSQGYQVQPVEQPVQQHYQPQFFAEQSVPRAERAQNESEENEYTIRRGRG